MSRLSLDFYFGATVTTVDKDFTVRCELHVGSHMLCLATANDGKWTMGNVTTRFGFHKPTAYQGIGFVAGPLLLMIGKSKS